VLISRLRQKLAAAGASDVVETVRGIGYRLRPSAESCDEPSAAATVRRDLRDASWQLQEAVIEVEHSGTVEQQLEATDALVRARHVLYASLAE
jgi:DNA-binding winged helix-turn-helix (wHTH) protein